MGRYLLLDVGAGTLDMLCHDSDYDLHYKAVVRSPVRVLGDRIRQTGGNLVVTGCEMGGGPVSQALIERAKTAEVVITRPAAATIHHDSRRVTAQGLRIVDADEADELKADSRYAHIQTGDLEPDRIRRIVEGFGVAFEFDAVVVCAQDHGVAPPGVSHLDFRHRIFRAALEDNPTPEALLFRSDEVPVEMNRLAAIARAAEALPTERVYVMDSGMAAILGASKDFLAADVERMILLDVATSHTVAGAMDKGVLCGFVEYHTADIDALTLDRLLVALADGKLSHRQILDQGGHGAYIRHAFGYDGVQLILATGPRRALVSTSRLPITFGAPWGDNMMTGTVGLMEAVRRREGLPPIAYL